MPRGGKKTERGAKVGRERKRSNFINQKNIKANEEGRVGVGNFRKESVKKKGESRWACGRGQGKTGKILTGETLSGIERKKHILGGEASPRRGPAPGNTS